MSKYTVLVELDVLLDTVMGTLRNIEESKGSLDIDVIKYIARTSNVPAEYTSKLTLEEYTAAWDTRDRSVLKLSRPSHALLYLREFLSSHQQPDLEHPDYIQGNVVVNTYPYNLDKTELRELFTLLKEILVVDTLKHVHMPYSEITPLYIEQHFNQIIIRDLNAWSATNLELLAKTPLKEVTLTCPLALLPEHYLNKDIESVAHNVRLMYIGHINLEILQLSDLSEIGIDQ